MCPLKRQQRTACVHLLAHSLVHSFVRTIVCEISIRCCCCVGVCGAVLALFVAMVEGTCVPSTTLIADAVDLAVVVVVVVVVVVSSSSHTGRLPLLRTFCSTLTAHCRTLRLRTRRTNTTALPSIPGTMSALTCCVNEQQQCI